VVRIVGDLRDGVGRQLEVLVEIHEPGHVGPFCTDGTGGMRFRGSGRRAEQPPAGTKHQLRQRRLPLQQLHFSQFAWR
jgi:hypothetical protein